MFSLRTLVEERAWDSKTICIETSLYVECACLPDKSTIDELNKESSLYIAMQNSFRGGDDYPNDSNLVLTQNQM